MHVIDPIADPAGFEQLLARRLASGELAVIIARRPCLLAAGKIKDYEQRRSRKANGQTCSRRARLSVTNVVIAGLGGQGVLKASDILAEAAFRAGFDVKKSEVHGMSQRGGSVTSDVRFGARGAQPDGAAGRGRFPGGAGRRPGGDQPRAACAPGGVLIAPGRDRRAQTRPSAKSLNVALLGRAQLRLARHPEDSVAGRHPRQPAARNCTQANLTGVRSRPRRGREALKRMHEQ